MKTKLLILLLTVCSFIATAQEKEEVKDFFWGKNDTYKSATTIPDKWKNESAVVIFKNENYDFHKYGQSVTYTSSIRKRIKLLDQAAVEEFSEFSFSERFYSSRSKYGFRFKKGSNMIGIKVVKPDGSEREVNIDEEAVEVDKEKKIAIANLEIGDIIDYYYYSIESFKSKLEYGFEPVESTLGDYYPIIDMKITFKTENDFFVNFNTYNGAPELKKVSPADSKERRYEFTAKDIEKNDFPRWFFPLAELPCYKFQVYFARSGKFEDRASAFLPEKESIIKKSVTKEDILNYYEPRFWPEGNTRDIDKFIKSNTFKNNEEMVKEVYYYTRHQYYTRYIEAFVVNEANIMSPFLYYGLDPVFFNTERQFINHFMMFLKSKKIDYDIVVCTPRYNGDIKDLLLESNTIIMLRVNTDTPIYLPYFSPYTNADQIDYKLENTNAYLLQVSKGKKITDVGTVKLPVSTYKENTTKETVNVALGDDFTSFKIDRKTSQFGHNKDYDQKEKMQFFDFVDEDYKKYGTDPLMSLVKNKKKQQQYTKEFNSLKNKIKDSQKEEFKESAESELGFKIDDHTLEITDTGRFGSESPFSYNESFTIKDNLIKKAGPNYVLELGKLIGGQIEIDDKEIKRTNNIYSTYPRSYEEEIVFTIPGGYTVTGLDKLNKKVENGTGGFVSSASIEGNKLTIKAYKYYANYYEPNSNWKDMIAFLDAAYQFTQEKVLLKKG